MLGEDSLGEDLGSKIRIIEQLGLEETESILCMAI